MRSIEDIPHEWKVKLSSLQETFPKAVIAGGCLRDWWTYRTRDVKDIDFFIPSTTDSELQTYLTNQDVIYSKSDKYGNFGNTDVTSVCKTDKYEYVALRNDRILERFDFGICQIMFDGEALTYTDQFVKDIEARTFTLLRADNKTQYDRSVRRFERLTNSRYLGYIFNPNGFGEFDNEV
jgi:hypothetical protein